MIGVLSKEHETPAVEEFFQLFKTPWEFYTPDHVYDVVISTRGETEALNAKLVLVFTADSGPIDIEKKFDPSLRYKNRTLVWKDVEFPVYGNILTFDAVPKPILRLKDSSEAVGIEVDEPGIKVVRIGYGLFTEVFFLLYYGQPVEYAHIPTLDIHIAILRNLILHAGIPVVEIPPVPEGYRFMVCLTHDVDFLGIREHKLDRSVFGFIYRVFFPYFLRDFSSKISWSKFVKNFKALLSLPGVYLGLFRDFWFQLDRYFDIEGDVPSTFFLIPFKGYAGEIDTRGNRPPKFRSSKYDINNYKSLTKDLIDKGKEIALHGLDAWHDSQRGSEELEAIRRFNGGGKVGIRMHWLYFSQTSPRLLEEAGFTYDSTLGYNDAVGYRSGTTQVFRLPGASNLYELPLHVQDTAMFYKKRMRLSESEALRRCKNLMSDLRTYGGVLTINWHQRSLGPERNWDAFYIELLRILKAENVCFVTAKQAVDWFDRRRSIHFNDIKFSGNRTRLQLSSENSDGSPHLLIRVHHPLTELPKTQCYFSQGKYPSDIPWSGEREIECAF